MRFTTAEAISDVPLIDDPDAVTDIIFHIGLNDTRRGFSTEKIRENLLDAQMKYHAIYRRARQHLCGLAPLSDSQIEVNAMVQKLAQHTGSNLISTKQLRDRATGQLRLNLMVSDGFHYSDIGVRIIAKEIKKSLYSDANKDNSCLAVLNNLAQSFQFHVP